MRWFGSQAFLAVQNDREWCKLCEIVLENPVLAVDSRFATNPDRQLTGAHQGRRAVFGELTVEEVVERLERAQVANTRMRAVEEPPNIRSWRPETGEGLRGSDLRRPSRPSGRGMVIQDDASAEAFPEPSGRNRRRVRRPAPG
ncbi:CoA transferase [Saccharopolyspora sp. NFXS83]|uniref:CoA transferase n=1 Tax=Saccharopolyspora sp. NFXS83 TaxID=2993560 RepID=UPI00224AB4B9|nr:CoA transferase [Saccharopolyspora sp. NFXS83]MCX2730625.1 CoA transferase [Saccharopolyspora sp. NFXS83]